MFQFYFELASTLKNRRSNFRGFNVKYDNIASQRLANTFADKNGVKETKSWFQYGNMSFPVNVKNNVEKISNADHASRKNCIFSTTKMQFQYYPIVGIHFYGLVCPSINCAEKNQMHLTNILKNELTTCFKPLFKYMRLFKFAVTMVPIVEQHV